MPLWWWLPLPPLVVAVALAPVVEVVVLDPFDFGCMHSLVQSIDQVHHSFGMSPNQEILLLSPLLSPPSPLRSSSPLPMRQYASASAPVIEVKVVAIAPLGGGGG